VSKPTTILDLLRAHLLWKTAKNHLASQLLIGA
jgi:hypothetical protein